EYKEAFDLFDKNRNGYINTKELGLLLRSLGQNPTENELMMMINAVDFDGSSQVDFAEFVKIMNQQSLDNETYVTEQIKEVIRAFDMEGKGYISVKDFQFILEQYNSLTQWECSQLVSKLDINRDGKIHYQG
ncbi:hypothetical protein HELRODRAFT_146486, partial [Helobdella robusta]|uniref:EF-hand domain-containing protein n=1 Tax=Helobdella robusta TaxID=6412 RepID=T1EJS5_HELRO